MIFTTLIPSDIILLFAFSSKIIGLKIGRVATIDK
jgi:hypothetical protein